MKKILIVEDEELMLDIIKDTLGKKYEIKGFTLGKQALEYMQKEQPDLVILDIKLPDITGLELLEKIRKLLPKVPIMMCTAYDSFKTDYQIWSANVADYIVKPIVLEELETKIKKIIGE
jgi:DNA-binding response OmpR family regulator